ncbi:hypothetical protein C8R46DRAFT_1029335 [Mycena filopes]|nr:hypothetical protein C8R46DRAFT_1029335 [Mycena filopes]
MVQLSGVHTLQLSRSQPYLQLLLGYGGPSFPSLERVSIKLPTLDFQRWTTCVKLCRSALLLRTLTLEAHSFSSDRRKSLIVTFRWLRLTTLDLRVTLGISRHITSASHPKSYLRIPLGDRLHSAHWGTVAVFYVGGWGTAERRRDRHFEPRRRTTNYKRRRLGCGALLGSPSAAQIRPALDLGSRVEASSNVSEEAYNGTGSSMHNP